MRVPVRTAVLISSCCTAFSTAAAQSPAIKTGLWETVSTTTMLMPPAMMEKMKAAGMAGSEPTTSTSKSCVTQEMIDKGIAFQSPREGCTYSEKTATPHGMSFTMTCSRQGGVKSTAKGTLTADGPEKATSLIRVETALPSGHGGGTFVTEIRNVGHFISPDCGDVKPATAGAK